MLIGIFHLVLIVVGVLLIVLDAPLLVQLLWAYISCFFGGIATLLVGRDGDNT